MAATPQGWVAGDWEALSVPSHPSTPLSRTAPAGPGTQAATDEEAELAMLKAKLLGSERKLKRYQTLVLEEPGPGAGGRSPPPLSPASGAPTVVLQAGPPAASPRVLGVVPRVLGLVPGRGGPQGTRGGPQGTRGGSQDTRGWSPGY